MIYGQTFEFEQFDTDAEVTSRKTFRAGRCRATLYILVMIVLTILGVFLWLQHALAIRAKHTIDQFLEPLILGDNATAFVGKVNNSFKDLEKIMEFVDNASFFRYESK
eukprot:TRINITY_DN56696_c0_g1_i1.p1 TRINITY_DN56696_c0_g1~~TRINITY_DN56696_c0_g1_i1.p1  ORF type:complete len:108 (-),score=8.07 TRINITY_DN56696_c0_g1_i1:375-698(-)